MPEQADVCRRLPQRHAEHFAKESQQMYCSDKQIFDISLLIRFSYITNINIKATFLDNTVPPRSSLSLILCLCGSQQSIIRTKLYPIIELHGNTLHVPNPSLLLISVSIWLSGFYFKLGSSTLACLHHDWDGICR